MRRLRNVGRVGLMANVNLEALNIAREVVKRVCPGDLKDFEAIADYQLRHSKPQKAAGIGISFDISIADGTLIGIVLIEVHHALKDLARRLAKIGVVAAERSFRNWLLGPPRARNPKKVERAEIERVIGESVAEALQRGLPPDACAAFGDIMRAKLLPKSGR